LAMKTPQIAFVIAVVGLVLWASGVAHAVPAIPEPGITFYGTCTDRQTGLPVTPTVVNWTVSDGTTTFTLTSATTPPTQIISSDGSVYYAVEVGFQTRAVGSTNFDPPTAPSFALPMQSVSPTYTFSPSVNGLATVIKSVNGQAVVGPLPEAYTIGDYGYASRGRVVRLDLAVGTPAPTQTYAEWATQRFGNSSLPEAQPGADPDHDGLTNQEEYTAGTDPTSGASMFGVQPTGADTGSGFVVQWNSVAGRTYVVERTGSLENGGWETVAGPTPGTGAVMSFTDTGVTNQTVRYYRVRIEAP
jgi:hypothetical protein